MRIVLGVLVGCLLLGCAHGTPGPGSGDDDDSPDGGTDKDPVTATLSLSPAASELTIENGAAVHQKFTATLTYRNGATRDVTAQTTFSTDKPALDASLIALDANELTANVATQLKVLAVYTDADVTTTTSANVVVRAHWIRIDPALPSNTPDKFTNAGVLALAPNIVYPKPDIVVPRNLGTFDVHWTDEHGNNVFELSLRTPLTDVRIYVPGGNGEVPVGTMPTYAAFKTPEWKTALGLGNELSYQIRGINTAVAGVVGAAAPITVQLSNEDMNGGLYYWASAAAGNNVTGIFRHDMANPAEEQAEQVITTAQTGGRCVACHVLSRDGKQMAITYQDTPTPPGPAAMIDLTAATPAPTSKSQRWTYGTFTPDGSQFLSIDNGVLVARNAADQTVLATMTTTPANAWVTQPDLSPIAKANGDIDLVYVRPALSGTDFRFKQGQIYTRTYNPTTRAFGAETPLLSDGLNNYYPSYSPDGAWIAFNKCDASDASYDCINATPWVMKANGTNAIKLALAHESNGYTNSSVHWAPFGQTLGTGRAPMFWLTMSSKRDYGVRLKNTGVAQQLRRAQLWMTPFFPERALANMDPSLPMFRLPVQGLDTSNQTAQWTQKIVEIP